MNWRDALMLSQVVWIFIALLGVWKDTPYPYNPALFCAAVVVSLVAPLLPSVPEEIDD